MNYGLQLLAVIKATEPISLMQAMELVGHFSRLDEWYKGRHDFSDGLQISGINGIQPT